MKRKPLAHAARLMYVLALSMCLAPAALAADPSEPTQPSPCYPTTVTRSEDGTEIRKMYDLGPEDDPGGIPRSDFEQDGYHYTLTDLLKQELPANESRQHTETVSVNSKSTVSYTHLVSLSMSLSVHFFAYKRKLYIQIKGAAKLTKNRNRLAKMCIRDSRWTCGESVCKGGSS